MLTANEHMVKLWKIRNKKSVQVANLNQQKSKKPQDFNQIAIPHLMKLESSQFQHLCKRTFDNVTAFHINSISVSTEQDRFLIADDLKISIWSVDNQHEAQEIVSLKPPKQDE